MGESISEQDYFYYSKMQTSMQTLVKELADDPAEVSGSSSTVWTMDPSVLLRNFCIFPSRDRPFKQNINCLTTLILIIGVILVLFKMPSNYVLLGVLISLLGIAVAANFYTKKEGFARDPHYIDDDFTVTNVTPLVAEEWHLNPPAYELVSDIAGDGRDFTQRVYGKGYEMNPPFAPYKQYITRTNLLPSDEAEVSLLSGGVTGARTYMLDAFTRHDLAHRENITRLYKKINNRRYRQQGYDTISPFASF